VIELEGVTKRYPDGTIAVGDLTLCVPTGSVTVLVGSSGCGKTTTLRMINRMVEPTEGTISIDGRDVTSVPIAELRRGIGYVIQHVGLFPHRTVLDNVATVPKLLGWSKSRWRPRALELLELVGLDPRLAARYPSQLSGGQQQRVGVARALAADPPVLLMDEPFGAVDPVQRTQLQIEFQRLQRDLRKTVVFVTHDIDEALVVADRVAVMATGGVVVQYGTPTELLAAPADPFVADFLGVDRRLRQLSLRPASDVAVRPVDATVEHGGRAWRLTLDDGSPVSWVSDVGVATPATVGPGATVRSLVDAALAGPPHTAVVVDDDGRAVGVVPLDVVLGSIG
jgi:osmoprotectant transport system ATP-binding protein